MMLLLHWKTARSYPGWPSICDSKSEKLNGDYLFLAFFYFHQFFILTILRKHLDKPFLFSSLAPPISQFWIWETLFVVWGTPPVLSYLRILLRPTHCILFFFLTMWIHSVFLLKMSRIELSALAMHFKWRKTAYRVSLSRPSPSLGFDRDWCEL